MARVRYIGAEPVTVPELGDRRIEPDEMVEVPDARFDGYVCQPGTWEAVEEPKDDEPIPKKLAPAVKPPATKTEV
ncbi:hypothetical protein [[Kitasatospora] papulosa]|uniref:hypothetical protein n=1 Tax=[Kitasatospora] papulosa TaxID=1464011 RepID=UPI00364516F3